MRNTLSVLAAIFGMLAPSFATINAVNGVTASTASNINGVTTPSAVNGQTLASGSAALVAHVMGQSVTPANSITTAGINTTGANLIVIAVSWYNATTAEVTVTDSNGNTWTALTGNTGLNFRSRHFYCVNPTVGAGHTFTSTGTATSATIGVQAWSGMSTTSPFDQQNGNSSASASTLACNSITPSQANSVAIASISFGTSRNFTSIDSGFTVTDSASDIPSNSVGFAMAYKIKTTTASEAPLFTISAASPLSVRISNFKY